MQQTVQFCKTEKWKAASGKANAHRLVCRNDPACSRPGILRYPKTALLLGVSRNLIYHLINTGKLVAYNLSVRRIIILKKDIDQLFQSRTLMVALPQKQAFKMPPIDDCYNMSELHAKFKISEGAQYSLIKRNNIDKFQVGRFTYVAKKFFVLILLNQFWWET